MTALTVFLTGPIVRAANDLWIGDTDNTFANLSNWTGGVTPNGNTPVFGAAGLAGTTLTNDIVAATYVGFTFNAGAAAFTIGGNAFTLTGNIVNNSTGAQTFSAGADVTTVTGRTITTTTGGGDLVFNNNFSQTAGGTTTLSGTGAVTMAGTNSFAFTTVDNHLNVTGGSLNITGTTTLSSTVNQAGTLRVSGGGTVTVSTGGTFNANGTSGATKGDSIIGVASVGTLTVAGGSLNYSANTGIFLGNTTGTEI